MTINNNPANSQGPGHQQVPDPRLDQLMENFRVLQEENRNLRQTLDQVMLKGQQQAPPQEDGSKSPFTPEVTSALDKYIESKIEKQIKPEIKKVENNQGYLVDQFDQVRFINKYGHEAFNKYQDKIKGIRDNHTRMGQYLTHEQAYQFAYFEENQKKPQPKPEAPQQPTFDPYLQRVVEPKAEAPQVAQSLQQPTHVNPAAAPPQVQVQQEVPQLPPVGPTNPSVMGQAAPQSGKLELTSDEKGLAAFADRFGDMEL